MAGIFLWSLGSSFRELRDLARDRTTRIIHGLEHATIRILLDEGSIVYGGLTHTGFFEIDLHTGREKRSTRQRRSAQR